MIRCTPFMVFFLFLHLAGCNMFQQSELIRVQRQRSAANKYATGNWTDRRDAAKDIVTYLGHDKNDLIVGTLVVASHDSSPIVRIEAVKGLGILKTGQALEILKNLALHDSDGNVRWYALKELRAFKDPSLAEIYIKGFESHDWLIREESVEGMLSMNDAIINEKLIPYVIKAINDPSTSVVYTTLHVMKFKDPRLYQAIADKLNSCSPYNYSLLEASLIALEGYQLDTKTREKVINLLFHDSVHIRLLALRILKKEKF